MAFFGMYGGGYLSGNPLLIGGGGLYSANIPFRMGYFGGNVSSNPLYSPNLRNISPAFAPNLSYSVQTPLISNLSGRINYFSGISKSAPLNQPNILNNAQINYMPQANSPLVNQPVQDTFVSQADLNIINNLQTTLDNAKKQRGIITGIFDDVKNATGLGLGSKKCQSYIELVKSGQMKPEDALNKIQNYEAKQKGFLNLFSGILTGVLAFKAVKINPEKGVKFANVLNAALIGAASKAGIKFADRATNNIDSDEFDAKLIAKDGLQGALDGGVSIATAGMGIKGLKEAKTAADALKSGAIQGLKAGALSGAVISSGDYAIDCGFGDQKFSAKNLVSNTLTGAAIGGATGAVIGGVSQYNSFNKAHPELKVKNEPAQETKLNEVQAPKNKKENVIEQDAPDTLDVKVSDNTQPDTPEIPKTDASKVSDTSADKISADVIDTPEILKTDIVEPTKAKPVEISSEIVDAPDSKGQKFEIIKIKKPDVDDALKSDLAKKTKPIKHEPLRLEVLDDSQVEILPKEQSIVSEVKSKAPEIIDVDYQVIYVPETQITETAIISPNQTTEESMAKNLFRTLNEHNNPSVIKDSTTDTMVDNISRVYEKFQPKKSKGFFERLFSK